MATSPQSNDTQQAEEPISSPSDLDGVSYLYGHPLLNSLSPLLHKTIYNTLSLNWEQIPLSVSSPSSTYPPPYTRSPPIEKFLLRTRSDPRFVGSSVTMPWKVSIMPHLDDLTEDAKEVGACNTIFLREADGRRVFVGTNTDCIGIREALLRNRLAGSGNEPYRGKPALIIGGGGTARAAIYAMRKWLGCSKIYIVNRDLDEIEAILEEDKRRSTDISKTNILPIMEPTDVAALEPPAAIVSAIPNYPPKTAAEIKTRNIIEAFLSSPPGGDQKGVILEMCYHPLPWTDIAEVASRSGWKVILGAEAMIWQGFEQARLWTGKEIVVVPGLVQKVQDVVARAIEERTRPRPNI